VDTGFSDYLRGWQERSRARAAARLERARQARAAAESVAGLLLRSFGARRVWLVGSLVHPEWFHERSDIDLVCEGVSPDRVPEADLASWEAAGGFDLDLVPIEEAPPSLRRAVETEGVLLRG
jgi:predicted nucleotidyltransferase